MMPTRCLRHKGLQGKHSACIKCLMSGKLRPMVLGYCSVSETGEMGFLSALLGGADRAASDYMLFCGDLPPKTRDARKTGELTLQLGL